MVNNYGIFFSYGGKVLRLPINPEEVPVARESNNTEYNVLGVGDINVPRTPKLKQISLSGVFPGRISAIVHTPNGFATPEKYMKFFQEAMDGKRIIRYTPVRYLENGQPYNTSDTGFDCTVESFTTSEKGGEPGDFYYELTIKEYRDFLPRSVKTVQQPNAAGTLTPVITSEPTRSVPKSQIVVGSTVSINGNYYYTSYGEEPHGVASGRRCVIGRIVDASRSCPYLIRTESGGNLGWVSKDAITVI